MRKSQPEVIAQTESEPTESAQPEIQPAAPTESAQPEAQPAAATESAQPSAQPEEPTFTLHASVPAELRAFVYIVQNAEAFGFYRPRVSLEGRLREFEMWEEGHRK